MTQATTNQGTSLLTVPEVAAQLRIARSSVYRLINSGALPTIRVGSVTRIAATDLAGYIAKNRSAA